MSLAAVIRLGSRFAFPGLLGLLGLSIATASADEGDSTPRFGSPDTVENLIFEDAVRTWKSRLQSKHGLSLGFDYTTNYFAATESLGETNAWGGDARFYGAWELVNRGEKNTGALVWKLEQRHRTIDIAPSSLAAELGYAGFISPPFSNEGLRITNLHWRQRLNQGRTTLVAGFLDATDYLDAYLLGSPWTGFSNFAFSTGTQTIPVPNDATLGVAFGTMLSKRTFLLAGVTDTNSDPTDLGKTIDSFFNDHEYFTSVELGLTRSQDRIYLENLHITLWHADARTAANTPAGWGVNISWNTWLGERWMPFVRAGYTDNGGSLLELAVSAGAGYRTGSGNILGFAGHWGKPNKDTYAPNLRDQYVSEVYFRWKIGSVLEVTPNLQLLVHPALNPLENRIWLFGLRARAAL